MKRLILALVCAMCLPLFACGEAKKTETKTLPAAETEKQSETEIRTATEPETSGEEEILTVSEIARDWQMTPLETYSWEREEKPEFIVLHFSSDVIAHPEDPYNAERVRKIYLDQEVSANYLVDRDGTVYCLIPEDRCAWHAGAGEWMGEEKYTNKLNRYSFGIEMLAIGTKEEMAQYMSGAAYNALKKEWIGYTDAQYEAVKALLADLCERYEITPDRQHILGHDEYSPSKNDPGSLFDWARVMPEP